MNKNTKTIIKMAVFNLLLAIISVFMFSPGFMGIVPTSTDRTKKMLFFIVLPILIIVFLAINYIFLAEPNKKVKLVEEDELKVPKDYTKRLQELSFKTVFQNEINTLVGQIRRITPKQASVQTILEQNFQPSEMTYIKFKTTVDEVISLFFENIKKSINRISVFDVDEYKKLLSNSLDLPEESMKLKREIYNEHIKFVQEIIKRNEQIITMLDNLEYELLSLDNVNGLSADDIEIINDMQELINNTKFYQ